MRNMLLEVEELGPCYKVGENLAKLCSSVLWKVEFLRGKISFFNYLLLYIEI